MGKLTETEAKFRNLTPIQQALLRKLSRGGVHVPYGDAHASALIHAGLASRSTAFGFLTITPAGRAALTPAQPEPPSGSRVAGGPEG